MCECQWKAASQGKITGVVRHLIPEGITHIQYADDTVLMVEGDEDSIIHMKFILYCFEWLSGLKINYHKSEAYIFGMGQKEQWRIANMLNCQLGVLPMKYLGMPISDGSLGMVAFNCLVKKVANRIPPWKGRFMSSGGRLILSNSCLSSLPIYDMSFYLLPKGTHKKMDSIRAKFFWRGASEEFKYHMVRWGAVCRPRDLGGLGIVNTRILNECLMVKWIWKWYHQQGSL
jgi:hypothetical protein